MSTTKAPVHFWIVAVVSLLWNLVGVFDYVATKLQLESYMSQFSAEQLEYFYSFPVWAVAAWACGVWGALGGSIGLLARKSWAVYLFGLSIAGLAVSSIFNFVVTEGADVMGQTGVIFTGVIWVIALALFFYSRAMTRRGVLT